MVTCQGRASQTVLHIINDCPVFGPPHGPRGLALLDGKLSTGCLTQLSQYITDGKYTINDDTSDKACLQIPSL